MKIIKEDIENLERYIGNAKVGVHTDLPIVMADAYEDSKKRQEEIDKEIEEKNKNNVKLNKVIGAEEQPVPKLPEEAKVNLEESLFEDYDSDVRYYSDMLFDMIKEGVVNAVDIAKDLIYWCSEDAIKHYMRVNDLIIDEEDIEENLNKCNLKEARKAMPFVDSQGNIYTDEDRSTEEEDDSYQDIWTVVYNEISPEHPNWILKSKLTDVPVWKRYNYDNLELDYDDNVIIHANEESDFDLAKRIADEYGLEFRGPKKRSGASDFIGMIVMPKE